MKLVKRIYNLSGPHYGKDILVGQATLWKCFIALKQLNNHLIVKVMYSILCAPIYFIAFMGVDKYVPIDTYNIEIDRENIQNAIEI